MVRVYGMVTVRAESYEVMVWHTIGHVLIVIWRVYTNVHRSFFLHAVYILIIKRLTLL